MPSDVRVEAARRAVSGGREAFRSSVAVTIEEVRGLLDARETPDADRSGRLADELGTFALGRIDAARLAEVLVEPHRVGADEAGQVERAVEALRSIQAAGDDAFVCSVDPGESLEEAVDRALAELGRAFGAARVVEQVRDGTLQDGEGAMMERFPFRRWSRKERDLAPPLVVRLEGAELCAGGLARFLDGAQKLVLVVDGEVPPAALARLITPGVLVIQTDDVADLDPLAECRGPAIAALVPDTAARFFHVPAKDGAPGTLTVEHIPVEEPDRRIGARSAFQQREELRHLRALARWGGAVASVGPTAATVTGNEADPADPAARLAAWLLHQADVSDLSQVAG